MSIIKSNGYVLSRNTKLLHIGEIIDPLDHIEVTHLPTKTEYTIGEALDLSGLKVSAVYDSGESKEVSSYTTNPVNGAVLSTSNTIVTVTYTEDGITKTTQFSISVKELSSISVDISQVKTEYTEGDNLDLTGLVVEATYTDGSKREVSGYTTSPINGAVLSISDTTVTITYTE